MLFFVIMCSGSSAALASLVCMPATNCRSPFLTLAARTCECRSTALPQLVCFAPLAAPPSRELPPFLIVLLYVRRISCCYIAMH